MPDNETPAGGHAEGVVLHSGAVREAATVPPAGSPNAHTPAAENAHVECRWCPPGCPSCEPDDCECYRHQDWTDKTTDPDWPYVGVMSSETGHVLEGFKQTWPAFQHEGIDTRYPDTDTVRTGWPKPTLYREHEIIHLLCNVIDHLRREASESSTPPGKSDR